MTISDDFQITQSGDIKYTKSDGPADMMLDFHTWLMIQSYGRVWWTRAWQRPSRFVTTHYVRYRLGPITVVLDR